MSADIIFKIVDELRERKRLLILQHENPDGDSISSSLALNSLFTRLGNRVSVVLPEEVPEIFQFLPGVRKIGIKKEVDLSLFDAVILVEAQSFERTGVNVKFDGFEGSVIIIDHHVKENLMHGAIVMNDELASSSAEIVYRFFKLLDIPIKKEEALLLFVGIYTDTGRFQESNTTSSSLKIASELVEVGVDVKKVYEKLYGENSLKRWLLLSKVLSNIEIDDGISIMKVKREYLKETGTEMQDTRDFINFARDIKGVEVAILLREDEGGVRVTFRSKKMDVSRIAKKFHGGGHKLASGCFLKGFGLEEAKRKVIEILKENL